jgi:antitoxin CptB
MQSKARIRWACRRGMLELDVLLMPFFDACFDDFSSKERTIFVRFLDSDDPDLFKWLMRHGQSDDVELAQMVDKILAFNQTRLHQA